MKGGDKVRLCGLSRRADLNGKPGVVQRPCDGGRWVVHVGDHNEAVSVHQNNLVKEETTMCVAKLTETREAVEAEVTIPASCAQAKFSFEKGSDDCTVRICSSGDSLACPALVLATPVPVDLARSTVKVSRRLLTLQLLLPKVPLLDFEEVDIDTLDKFAGVSVFMKATPAGEPKRPFATVCCLVNTMLNAAVGVESLQNPELTRAHLISNAHIGVVVIVKQALARPGDIHGHPLLEVLFIPTLDGPNVGRALDVHTLLSALFGDHLFCTTTDIEDEAILLLVEILETNSLRIKSSCGQQRFQTYRGVQCTRSFIGRVHGREERQWEYSQQNYRESQLPRMTPSLKKIFSDRKLQGLVPQSRGFDRSSICLCCGTVLEVRFWCHECRRLACCSAACLKALQDIHEPWCKGGRPIGPVGHASTAPRPSAVILKEVANKLAVSGEQQHRTQNAISSLVSLLKPELVQLAAGYQRYAVGGSFAKLTAMQFKFDVDLVLLFGFESTTKANFASDHAELIDRVEEILCHIQGLDIIGRSSKCIQCRWKSNKLDVLVGRLFGALQHCKTRTPDDLASTILQLQDGYNADARSRLSPSFTECSVQFMSSQPLAVLRAIRLVKFWKHVSIAGEISSCKTIFVRLEDTVTEPPVLLDAFLSSYAMELLLVHVYRVLKHSKTANFESTDVLFREFLLFLSRLCAEKPAVVCFREPPGANVPATHFNLQQPLVLWDPVNPAINVVQHFRRWSPLIELARKALCCLALDEDPVNALLHTDEFALFKHLNTDPAEQSFPRRSGKSKSNKQRPPDGEDFNVRLEARKAELQRKLHMMAQHEYASFYEDQILAHKKELAELDEISRMMFGK